MKLIFAGTPQFAATALDTLVESGFDIGLVLTRPDRSSGRGLHTVPSAVKVRAQAHHLSLVQPENLREPEFQADLRAINADALVVAAYGLILPEAVLAIPPRGCLNIHASLLPRWRGAAPIQRALLAGDRETGISIMQMDEGLDTGAILLQEKIPIDDEDTAQTLHDKLALIGARCLVHALHANLSPRVQDATLATYADKITKPEAMIDWSRSSIDICRMIRAFNPAPGAVTSWNGSKLKIWRAQPVLQEGSIPGTVIHIDAQALLVAAGAGAVKITELQKAGAKRMPVAAFIAGAAVVPGTRLGT